MPDPVQSVSSTAVPQRRSTDVKWMPPERPKRVVAPLDADMPPLAEPVFGNVMLSHDVALADPLSNSAPLPPRPDQFRSYDVERWMVRGVDHQPSVD